MFIPATILRNFRIMTYGLGTQELRAHIEKTGLAATDERLGQIAFMALIRLPHADYLESTEIN